MFVLWPNFHSCEKKWDRVQDDLSESAPWASGSEEDWQYDLIHNRKNVHKGWGLTVSYYLDI